MKTSLLSSSIPRTGMRMISETSLLLKRKEREGLRDILIIFLREKSTPNSITPHFDKTRCSFHHHASTAAISSFQASLIMFLSFMIASRLLAYLAVVSIFTWPIMSLVVMRHFRNEDIFDVACFSISPPHKSQP